MLFVKNLYLAPWYPKGQMCFLQAFTHTHQHAAASMQVAASHIERIVK